MKSKEERDVQWERVAWRISARTGWSIQEALQYLSQRAIGFWFSRTAREFMKGITRDETSSDPYLDRAAEYQRMAGLSGSGAINLW